MTSRTRGIVLGVFLAAIPAMCFAADLIVMVEDAAQPFSRADGTGYANDIVRAAFRAAGVDVGFDVVPYARCKKSVETGETPACFNMSWAKEFDGAVVFADTPIFQVYADVFQSKRASVNFSDTKGLNRGATIGIVNEYEYPDSLYRLQDKGVMLERGVNETAILKMLGRGRIDAAVVMTSDFEPRWQKIVDAGLASAVNYAFRSGIMKSYIGFSLKHSQGEWARTKFNEGYRRIVADGTAARIQAQWMKTTPQ